MTAIGDFRDSAFDAYLRANNIPIVGLSNANGTVEALVINFDPMATTEQRDWAENQKSLFDWREQRPLDRNTIAVNLAGLSEFQYGAVQRHVAAYVLQQNPDLATAISAVANVPLPVTEPVPT